MEMSRKLESEAHVPWSV